MLKYSINFSLHKRSKTESDTFPVRMRVSFNHNRPDFYTGVNLTEIDWNSETQRSWQKKSLENRELDKLQTIIEDIFEEFEYEHKRFPTVEQLREAFKIATNKKPAAIEKEDSLSLQDLFDLHSAKSGNINQWSYNTYRKYNKIKNHFYLYNKNLEVDSLTEDDLIGFIKYLQTAPIDFISKTKKEPLRNSSVAKMIVDFKTVLRWASSEKIYSGHLHNDFRPKFKGSAGDLKDLVFLTWDELMKMYHYEFSDKDSELDKVRDVFCFCSFTGLRYSDVKKLKRNHIKKDFIVVTTEKTIDPLRIELNDYSEEILKKYEEADFPNNLALPVKRNTDYNKDLRKIAEILEFDEEINEVYFVGSKRFEHSHKKYEVLSSHAGRRTFVVNGLTLGISDKVIMKWTGHKNHDAMRPYIKIVDDLKQQEMKKFNRK